MSMLSSRSRAMPRCLAAMLSGPLAAFMSTGASACDVHAADTTYRAGRYGEAATALLPCAEDGNAKAQLRLATLFQTGQGVDTDMVEASRWYRAAANQGMAEAQFHLGLMYLRGEGVTQDPHKVFGWLEKASRGGFGDAVTLYEYVLTHDTGEGC